MHWGTDARHRFTHHLLKKSLSSKPINEQSVTFSTFDPLRSKASVYEKVTMSQCWKETGKNPIKTDWEDTNKGTSECPNMRSGCVAKEYNTGPRPDLFSAASPLEGVKLVISEAASRNQTGTVLLVIDVRRAYFYAKARRRVYIELPEGDGGGPGSRQCGLLRKSLYVTRDAAQNWECELGGFLEETGLLRGQASTCLYSEVAPGNQRFGPW